MVNSLGIYKIHFIPLIPEGRAQMIEDLVLTPVEYKKLLTKTKVFSQQYNTQIVCESPLSCILDPSVDLTKPKPCVAGFFWLGVSFNGDIIPCPIMRLSIGNIRKDDFIKIWRNSKVLKILRDSTLLKGACQSCKCKITCNGGCRGLAYYKKGDFTWPDPLCWIANP